MSELQDYKLKSAELKARQLEAKAEIKAGTKKNKYQTAIGKFGNKRLANKKILKTQKTGTYTIQTAKNNIYDDPNRFFKDNYEEEKRDLFFTT